MRHLGHPLARTHAHARTHARTQTQTHTRIHEKQTRTVQSFTQTCTFCFLFNNTTHPLHSETILSSGLRAVWVRAVWARGCFAYCVTEFSVQRCWVTCYFTMLTNSVKSCRHRWLEGSSVFAKVLHVSYTQSQKKHEFNQGRMHYVTLSLSPLKKKK